MTQKKIYNLKNRSWAHESRLNKERELLELKAHLKDKYLKERKLVSILKRRIPEYLIKEIEKDISDAWPNKKIKSLD